MNNNLLRHLPSVDRLLSHEQTAALVDLYGHSLTVDALRLALENARTRLLENDQAGLPTDAVLLDQAASLLNEWLHPTLRRVINATGVIVHTNLGRAPLSDETILAMQSVAGGYSTLEFDLESGRRGKRSLHAEALLKRITGAEAALVVNNNAAGVLLTLTALAGPTRFHQEGRGVIISRGQLVEIGGGFRIPDIMAQSGARLIEVGTTNRTHRHDYLGAIDETTGLILRAHRSNFALVGFTTEPALAELCEIAAEHDLPVADDLGSGSLLDTSQFGLAPEPTVHESLAAGADVVMFSGDKLLGGPQAGILVGKAEIIDRLKRHPLARAIRADKLALSGITATLLHYLKGEALEKVPVWRMISMPLEEIRERAQAWATRLTQAGIQCKVSEGRSAVGGGSLPGETLPSTVLLIDVESADRAAARLRAHEPPVIVRIEENQLVIDPRTVLERDKETLLAALATLA